MLCLRCIVVRLGWDSLFVGDGQRDRGKFAHIYHICVLMYSFVIGIAVVSYRCCFYMCLYVARKKVALHKVE